MVELTTAEVQKFSDRLVILREQLRSIGATALTPKPEWAALHKEVAVLKRKLNADAANKRAAARAAARAAMQSRGIEPDCRRVALWPSGAR